MIPYITNRGGPMIGLEALSLQGLPVDELLLTRETEDQLADLAGNAMSTTVIGASIMAALVVGKKLLKGGPNEETDDAMEIDVPSGSIQDHITGDKQLDLKPLDLATTVEHSLTSLLKNAERSSRLCDCEGRTGMTSRDVQRCEDCGTSACVKCGGRPEHKYRIIDLAASPRLPPTEFSAELKAALPMCLSIEGVDEACLQEIRKSSNTSIEDGDWDTWAAAVLAASQSELRFAALKRQEIWVATYGSPTASLELLLHPKRAEWRLFGKPEASVPANSPVRGLLAFPVARFVCNKHLLDGVWEFALPQVTSFDLEIKGLGELVPAWESRLGLQGPSFKERIVHPQLQVIVPAEHASVLDRDISGVYNYLPQCGAANSSLHKKVDNDASLPDLFFFVDPTRCGDSTEDAFVFSISKRRYEYGETRPIICRLNPKWRQNCAGESETVTCHVPCVWVPASKTHLLVSVILFVQLPEPYIALCSSRSAQRSMLSLPSNLKSSLQLLRVPVPTQY
jgi:hypothetical protein